jgi:hypothetical protein
MNSDKLISIDDADLEGVAGGIGAALDLGRLGGASLSLGEGGLKTSLTLFGKTLSAGINFFFGFKG